MSISRPDRATYTDNKNDQTKPRSYCSSIQKISKKPDEFVLSIKGEHTAIEICGKTKRMAIIGALVTWKSVSPPKVDQTDVRKMLSFMHNNPGIILTDKKLAETFKLDIRNIKWGPGFERFNVCCDISHPNTEEVTVTAVLHKTFLDNSGLKLVAFGG